MYLWSRVEGVQRKDGRRELWNDVNSTHIKLKEIVIKHEDLLRMRLEGFYLSNYRGWCSLNMVQNQILCYCNTKHSIMISRSKWTCGNIVSKMLYEASTLYYSTPWYFPSTKLFQVSMIIYFLPLYSVFLLLASPSSLVASSRICRLILNVMVVEFLFCP